MAITPELAAVVDDLTLDRPSLEPASDGIVRLSHDRGHVGDDLTIEGRELPPNTDLDLVWHTYDGGWELQKYHEVAGTRFETRTDSIATVGTDEAGCFTENWTIPEDYGGVHPIEVRHDGEALAIAQYEVVPSF
ncbi:MAG: hypothetical protein ABEI98_02150, partial [Halorhabdus sp.]